MAGRAGSHAGRFWVWLYPLATVQRDGDMGVRAAMPTRVEWGTHRVGDLAVAAGNGGPFAGAAQSAPQACLQSVHPSVMARGAPAELLHGSQT